MEELLAKDQGAHRPRQPVTASLVLASALGSYVPIQLKAASRRG